MYDVTRHNRSLCNQIWAKWKMAEDTESRIDCVEVVNTISRAFLRYLINAHFKWRSVNELLSLFPVPTTTKTCPKLKELNQLCFFVVAWLFAIVNLCGARGEFVNPYILCLHSVSVSSFSIRSIVYSIFSIYCLLTKRDR